MDGLYSQKNNEMRVMRLQLPICDRMVTTEVSSEVSLPDYQPEIKRLLRVSATVQPPTRYVGGGAMEFSGAVDYCIIYTGNDGQMYCFPTSADYSFRVPLEAGPDFDLSDALVCYAHSESEAIISRVGGPRRMSIKCRLRSHVKAYGSCVVEEKRTGDRGAWQEERLWKELETSVSAYGVGAPFTLSDEILLEEGGEADYRIISGDVQILINEAQCAGGRVNCRGEAVLKLLLQKEGEGTVPMAIWRKLPIDQSVELDGVTAAGTAAAMGSCTELTLSMEDGRVLCEAEIVLEARADRPETVSYTCDMYATDRESSCTVKEYRLPRHMCRTNVNFTQNESRTIEELGLPTTARVVDIHGTAQLENVEADRDRLILSGKCRYTMVVLNDGELSAKEIELPFRYILDGMATPGVPFSWEGQAQLLSARARMDGQRVGVDAELGIWLCAMGEQSAHMVESVEIGAAVERVAGQMLICYPDADDTLWSVAKRYGVPIERMEKSNHIGGEKRADDRSSLAGVRCLII